MELLTLFQKGNKITGATIQAGYDGKVNIEAQGEAIKFIILRF